MFLFCFIFGIIVCFEYMPIESFSNIALIVGRHDGFYIINNIFKSIAYLTNTLNSLLMIVCRVIAALITAALGVGARERIGLPRDSTGLPHFDANGLGNRLPIRLFKASFHVTLAIWKTTIIKETLTVCSTSNAASHSAT